MVSMTCFKCSTCRPKAAWVSELQFGDYHLVQTFVHSSLRVKGSKGLLLIGDLSYLLFRLLVKIMPSADCNSGESFAEDKR
jgi:5-carboxymethyl-2-hydroxymuconate isomerase